MPEKEPRKKAVKKTPAGKKAEKKPAAGATKKTAPKKAIKKPPAEAKKTAAPKPRAARAVKQKEIPDEVTQSEHKIEESPEQASIEAAKFYPPQMAEKNGKKYGEKQPPAERDETGIPGRYYDNKLVLMARDPYWCYSYWDISSRLMTQKTDEAKKHGPYKLVIRIYDVTDIVFNGSNAHKHMDIEVTGDANNWYINVWEAGRAYIAELGFRTDSGKFILIARSNTVGAPTDRVSEKTDEEWMVIDEDFEELLRMSGGGKFKGGGSEGFRSLEDSPLSSDTLSSISSPVYMPEAEKGFFLWADTELILYGATEKGAKLTVKGEAVKLKEDGSFSLRFHLPDGAIDLPIEAASADGRDKKSIKINVQRKTE